MLCDSLDEKAYYSLPHLWNDAHKSNDHLITKSVKQNKKCVLYFEDISTRQKKTHLPICKR